VHKPMGVTGAVLYLNISKQAKAHCQNPSSPMYCPMSLVWLPKGRQAFVA